MKNRDLIFYNVVAALNKCEVDIVNAQILNASDGYALQTFRLAPVNVNNENMEFIADQVVHYIEDKLNNIGDAIFTSLSESSKHRHFRSPTIINFRNTNDNRATQLKIETIDRTGVLANIAKILVDCNIRIINARITSVGEKAIDHFTISTLEDCAIAEEQQKILEQKLKETL